MSAEEVLRSTERSASSLSNNPYVSSVVGKSKKLKTSKKIKSMAATGMIVVMVAIFAIVLGSGNIIPAKVQENLVEQTDVQYADMVASKMLVFQQAMLSGTIPEDTVENLKSSGVTVGHVGSGGEFTDGYTNGTPVALLMNDKVITANSFMNDVYENINLYNAINQATYGRAAGYYDEAANEVFSEIGTNRNNYSNDSNLDEVVDSLMGSGSDVSVNSVYLAETAVQNPETGVTETTYNYIENGQATKSNAKAKDFIQSVQEKITSNDATQSTLNAADSLKVADTISKEQRSSLFYLLFMENVSKMKAGDGNDAKVNEVMNYLYTPRETEIVDVNTGKVLKVSGTALESPSLYSVLSGSELNTSMVNNYSSDRILKTTEKQLNTSVNRTTIINTVTSTDSKTKGSIGRYLDSGEENGLLEILSKSEPTINSSLVDNSYDTIQGINAGEFLVEGAINVGKSLAIKGSGATAGDSAAVAKYNTLNNKILAMEAKVDRMNRSPFDITSKNTFLGSIVYNIAVIGSRYTGVFSSINTISNITNNALLSLISNTYADGEDGYLANHGDCETLGSIGAVGSAQCATIATFDTSTLNNPFGDTEFMEFVEENTTLDGGGERKIKDGSVLADFILYNDERKTPLGVTDGGILDSLNNKSSSIPFMSDILSMVEIFLGADDNDKKVATGESFVNSVNNPDWDTYKYAQRYVALARATSMLKQYSNDKTAYSNIKYFEGNENPVIAYKKYYYNIANK